MLKVGIILGSTRPGRNGEAVAHWVRDLAVKRGDADYELVDLKDYDLGVLDEPEHPATGRYQHEHTKRWSATIAPLDAFVIVTPSTTTPIPARSRTPLISCTRNGATRRPVSSATAWTARPGDLAPAARPGSAQRGHRVEPGRALHPHRLRRRLQAGRRPRGPAEPGSRPGPGLGLGLAPAQGLNRLSLRRGRGVRTSDVPALTRNRLRQVDQGHLRAETIPARGTRRHVRPVTISAPESGRVGSGPRSRPLRGSRSGWRCRSGLDGSGSGG